jgi:SAM-dependent methyltransferase
VTAIDKDHPAYAGQAVYTPAALRIYDFLAFRVNAPFLWRASAASMLELYDAHVSSRHLDVGVGTGYFPDRCRFPVADPEITLVDLNPTALSFAARRLQRYTPRTQQANVLEPWGLPARSFDSIALSMVLLCAPGSLPEKAVAFDHARECLAPGGSVFGGTLLSGGVDHTRRSRLALKAMNRRGVFNNLGDHLDDLDAALAKAFVSHEIKVEGAVALFVAKGEG